MEELRKEVANLRREQAELIEIRLEDQRRIDQVEAQVSIMTGAFNDLKNVEKEFETQYLIQQPLELHIDENSDTSLMKHFCCFFCL